MCQYVHSHALNIDYLVIRCFLSLRIIASWPNLVRVKFFGESQSINAKDKKRTFRYPLGVEARTKKGSQ